uniref:Bridge-like lipid transfer protein family member 1 N-terminal domain-containing protein n=1 Tax=Megaselia scalaris TaxID=36166 RepID=T1GBW8_MEGSC
MWLMISLIITLAWVVYINFYNARIFGMIVTKIINRWYITGAHFRLGSLSITPIAGKIISELYDKLEKTFGLSPSIFIPTDLSAEEKAKMKENEMNLENKRQNAFEKHKNSEAMNATTWRDLIPVIKIDICSGRFVFGNRLTPTTLSISMDEAHCTYSTKPAACQLDKFMHFVKAKVENSKVMFAPSPKYTGLADEPPRYMGEGFVVMMSNFMDLYFYMDEPGVVPDEPVHLTLANGDIIEPPPPQWGIEVKCGKGTDFSYGPWADRQRDHLFKFFFPSDWEEMQVDENPKAGQLRQYQTFEVTLCTFKEATIDILFSKDKETNAMHVTIGPGSSVEVSLPWVTHADGYQTKISGQLLHVEATTSLQYRSLADVLLKEFELLTLSNEYNWIDCSSTNQENNHLAFCGDLLDLSFVLPFDDFLPQTVELKFWIHGEGLDLSMYIPEVSSTRSIVLAIDDNAKIMTRGGEIKNRPELYSKKWRKICQRSSGWVDCWSVNIIALSITYVYHPCPPLGPDPQADITTPEKEEILLSPMRMPSKKRLSPNVNWQHNESYKFDPSSLPADKVTVDLEIGSSVMLAYGTVLRNFINLKENIFGEDQLFTDMEQSNVKMKDPGNSIQRNTCPIKKRTPYSNQPLEVIVSVMIHDIQAHLMKNCNENDPPCPVILIERLGFEMNKRYTETELQVLVSPSYLITSDTLVRPNRDKHINQGHLLLSAVQVRGHAMFSNEGCALDEDTLEYAWLLEIQLGKLSGKLTLPQLFNICVGLETFILLTMDPENCLKSPKMIRNCHHGVPTNQCPQTNEENKYKCPSCEDIKYTMTRVSIDAIDIYLVESGTALHTWISPIRLSTCNLHGQRVKSGISGLLPSVLLRLFMVNNGGSGNLTNSHSNTNTTGSNRSGRARKDGMSTYRSDLEIHAPDSKALPKRPQSSTELSDDVRRIHGLATPLRKITIPPRPEFRHYVHDVSRIDESIL